MKSQTAGTLLCALPIVLPRPKFELFQSVTVESDRGYIIGMVWSNGDSKLPGWWYSVQYLEMPSSPWLEAGYVEELPEKALLA